MDQAELSGIGENRNAMTATSEDRIYQAKCLDCKPVSRKQPVPTVVFADRESRDSWTRDHESYSNHERHLHTDIPMPRW